MRTGSDRLGLAVLGACIGALAGISGSPVAGTIIASLIATATLALSVIGGFAKGGAEVEATPGRPVDIRSVALFAFCVLVAIVAASFVRSAIVRAHADREVVRALSAPPETARIIDSWLDAGHGATREELAALLLEQRFAPARSPDAASAADPSTPIPLSDTVGGDLGSSCAELRPCAEEGADETRVRECMRANLEDMIERGQPIMSGLARLFEGYAFADETERYRLFDRVAAEICEAVR